MRPLAFAALFVSLCQSLLAAADPGAGTSAAAIVAEMNFARQRPDLYAQLIESRRAYFRGNVLVLPGQTPLLTREGVGGIDNAVSFLRSTRPLPPLAFSPGMSRAAADHCADQAGGGFGHSGGDRSSPADRISRYGTWSVLWGENIAYGKRTAREIVIALIVDDGLRARKHRKNIFNPMFAFAGAAVGPHARFGAVCGIDFAGDYIERGGSAEQTLVARNW